MQMELKGMLIFVNVYELDKEWIQFTLKGVEMVYDKELISKYWREL